MASLIETPSAVKELVDKTETLLTLFLDEWFKCHGTEYIAHYPFFPMRGGFTFSEDEVGEFSPAMFREFCLPSINRLSRRYGGCSMHCCANSRHQWPAFLEIEGLRLLNLCQPEGEINDASLYFSDRVCQYHYCGIGRVDEQNGVPVWVRALPNTACVVIETTAHSRAEAQEQLRVLRAFERARKI